MGPFRTTGALVGAIVGGVVVVSGLSIGGAYWANSLSAATAEPRGERQVRENTQANGDFRQSVYENFYNLCTSAQTAQDQITTLELEKKTATPDRVDNLNTSISALKFSLSASVNTYNNDANEYTRGPFLDKNLPYPLNTKDTIKCV